MNDRDLGYSGGSFATKQGSAPSGLRSHQPERGDAAAY